ncbi:hypothetical protein CTZ27_03765 [Streptomyces griseocarneus]|nr:hypothetical protein CTZ27_03765 [Streptomyces griseocarneus]
MSTTAHPRPTGRNALTERYLRSPAGASPIRPGTSDQVRLEMLHDSFESRYLTRPVFLEAAEVRRLEADLDGTMDLLFSLPDRLFDGDAHAFAAAVGLRPDQARLALRPPVREPARIGRADLYHDGTAFRLLEFNLSSALGGPEIPELNRLMRADRALADFTDAEGLVFPDTVAALAEAIATAAESSGTPTVAVMDWSPGYHKTEPALRALAALLEPHGIDAFACHTDQVRERDGRITVDGRHVDAVHRYFTLGELTADAASTAEAERLLDAFARCDVPVLSPLRTSMHGNKRALAMLWEERCRATLDPAESALIDRFLPWTHALRPGTAEIRGESVDLLAHCRRHRDRLVLKPSHGLGGSGTVLGRAVTDDAWDRALQQAAGQRYIVQELVDPRPEHFPTEDGTGFTPWSLNWGAFLIGHRYAGTFLRGLPAGAADVISYDNKAYAGCVFQEPADSRGIR